MYSWKKSALWGSLQELAAQGAPYADQVIMLLGKCMPQIELMLHAGGTSPSSFTLHDAGHSYRVADRMAWLMSPPTLRALSALEIGALLLSAYLHDIGMTPEASRVHSLDAYLREGSTKGLDDTQKHDFESWLDENFPTWESWKQYPLEATESQIAIAYYIRDRHNDWSTETTRTILTQEVSLYPGWIEDLVAVCQSHHEGYDRLIDSDLDPTVIGQSPNDVIFNRRYVACLLRVADVMEIDPERTPEVILRHRDVIEESRVFWQKDHYIHIRRDETGLALASEPPNARIHRAVLETADQINEELETCKRLAVDGKLSSLPGSSTNLGHDWNLPPRLTCLIQPKGDAYEYIDGTFRPDARRVLQLLGSTSLYQEPQTAIRELIQNAFDAIRERVAQACLASDRDQSYASELASVYRVEVWLEETEGRKWLVCRDDGAGMGRTLIERHLLVSGSHERRDIIRLRRACANKGLRFDRTGRFGIGVLSYFMLADRLVFETLRSPEFGDNEPVGWRFEIDGTDEFGELKELRPGSLGVGTTVKLRLKRDCETLGLESREHLAEYVRSIIVRSPCRLIVKGPDGTPTLDSEPGWLRSTTSLTRALILQFGGTCYEKLRGSSSLLSSAQQESAFQTSARQQEVQERLTECVEWHVEELEGTDDYYARVLLPYFKLPGGHSLAYIDIDEDGVQREWLGMDCFRFQGGARVAVGGSSVSARTPTGNPYTPNLSKFALLEIDLFDDSVGKLSIDRYKLVLSSNGKSTLVQIEQTAHARILDFVAAQRQSPYHLLSMSAATIGIWHRPEPYPQNPSWVASKPDDEDVERWQDITSEQLTYFPPPHRQPTEDQLDDTDRQLVLNLRPLRGGFVDRLYPTIALPNPRQIAFVEREEGLEPVGIWSLNPGDREDETGVSFPTSLGFLVSMDVQPCPGYYLSIFNRDHPVSKAVTEESSAWASSVLTRDRNPTPHIDQILADPSFAAAWILEILYHADASLWQAVQEHNPSFLQRVARSIWGREDSQRVPRIGLLRRHGVDATTLVELDGSQMRVLQGNLAVWQKLPRPDSKWLLQPGRTTERFSLGGQSSSRCE